MNGDTHQEIDLEDGALHSFVKSNLLLGIGGVFEGLDDRGDRLQVNFIERDQVGVIESNGRSEVGQQKDRKEDDECKRLHIGGSRYLKMYSKNLVDYFVVGDDDGDYEWEEGDDEDGKGKW